MRKVTASILVLAFGVLPVTRANSVDYRIDDLLDGVLSIAAVDNFAAWAIQA